MKDAKALSTLTSEEHSQAGGGVDYERLRNVTRLLGGHQQGLNAVLFGILVFLIEVPWGWSRSWAANLASLAGMAIFVAAWRRWIPWYYEKRFGRVEPQEMSARQFAILILVLIALFFFGEPVSRYLGPLFSGVTARLHLAISDPSHQINLWPPFFWMAVFISYLRWPLRRIDSEPLCFVLLGLLASISIALFPTWHPGAERLETWKVLNAGGFGLSLIAMGFHEHIGLIRALPKTVAEGTDE